MAIEKLIKAVIMGPPGSGKGTIANRIVKDFGMHHLASGDLLRKHVALKTDLGRTANEYISKGLLVPDKLTVDLIIREIAANKSGKHWLLDGFPRTISQCEELMKLHQLSVVINLDVPFDEIVNRVKDRYIHEPSGRIYNLVFSPPKKPGLDDVTGEPLIQRHDDKESTVRARLDTYQRQTSPLLEYFQQHKLLINFKGRYSNEIWPKVHKELCKFCTPLQYTHYS